MAEPRDFSVQDHLQDHLQGDVQDGVQDGPNGWPDPSRRCPPPRAATGHGTVLESYAPGWFWCGGGSRRSTVLMLGTTFTLFVVVGLSGVSHYRADATGPFGERVGPVVATTALLLAGYAALARWPRIVITDSHLLVRRWRWTRIRRTDLVRGGSHVMGGGTEDSVTTVRAAGLAPLTLTQRRWGPEVLARVRALTSSVVDVDEYVATVPVAPRVASAGEHRSAVPLPIVLRKRTWWACLLVPLAAALMGGSGVACLVAGVLAYLLAAAVAGWIRAGRRVTISPGEVVVRRRLSRSVIPVGDCAVATYAQPAPRNFLGTWSWWWRKRTRLEVYDAAGRRVLRLDARFVNPDVLDRVAAVAGTCRDDFTTRRSGARAIDDGFDAVFDAWFVVRVLRSVGRGVAGLFGWLLSR